MTYFVEPYSENLQDIINAMNLVSCTKTLLQNMRHDDWDAFLINVESFCKTNDTDILKMSVTYKVWGGRSCQQQDPITVEHYYRIDIFSVVIDFQLLELNNRFSEGAVEILRLSSTLDAMDAYKSFEIENICSLAEKFYPQDFTSQEIYLFAMSIRALWAWCSSSSEFSKYVYTLWIMSRVSWNKKVKGLLLDWHIDSSCINSFYFHSNYRTSIFCDEACQNITL